MAKKERAERAKKNIDKLVNNKLSYKPKMTVKRHSSFHGKLDKFLGGASWEKHVNKIEEE